MSKRTRKTAKPAKPRKTSKPGVPGWERAKAKGKAKGKMGGARPGSGPKPKLGAGVIRDVIKTVRLSAAEHEAQRAAVKRSGAKDWAHWARGLLNLQAEESARSLEATRINSMTGEPSTPDDPQSYTDSSKIGTMPQRGAVVVPCVCGHASEEHGGDPTACGADLGAEGCDCAAYEADPDAENASLAEHQSGGPA